MASAWGNSWGSSWGNAWGDTFGTVFLVDTWGPRKKRKKLEALRVKEPVIAKEIEILAVREKAVTFEQMQAHFNEIDLAYTHAYHKIYVKLVEEIREEAEKEYESVAACMAALVL